MTAIACACINDKRESELTDEHREFTIKEARQYFVTFNKTSTKSGSKETEDPMGPKRFSPGEFTPVWDRCRFENSEGNAVYYIPINSQYRYKAISRTNNSNGRNSVYTSYLEQQLVISKNLESGRISSCILSIVSDKSSRSSYSMHEKTIFSGIVVYSMPQLNVPLKIEKYVDGDIVLTINMINKDGKKVSSKVLNTFFRNYKFLVAKSIQTRSGEDFWDWFLDEIFPDLNDGDSLHFGTDDNGNNYLEDQDGNRYDIPEGIVDGEDYWDESNEDWTWMPDPETDTSEEGGLMLKVEIIHSACGNVVETIYISMDDPSWEGFCYCSTCKHEFYVEYK